MIISCPNCATRLQLDDAKVPTRPFTVRCPKCQNIIDAQPPPPPDAGSALAAGGDLPATTRSQRVAKSSPPPVFDVATNDETAVPASAPAGPAGPAAGGSLPAGTDVLRLLTELLGGAAASAGLAEKSNGGAGRPAWGKRRALICAGAPYRRDVARGLVQENYEVFLADTTAQAIERMREEKLDLLVIDEEFDMSEQGAAFITRELGLLRPAERRRLVVVHLSSSARTEDAHAAFLANVNLVVNTGDLDDLPRAVERTVRDLNELYKDFNRAFGVPGI